MLENQPELAELMSNPAALGEKMQEVMQLLQSEEGQALTSKMMTEMKNVLTDPQRMKEGLEQFASNPMLKGMADSIPELQEVLENPEKLEETVNQATQMFGKLGGLGSEG